MLANIGYSITTVDKILTNLQSNNPNNIIKNIILDLSDEKEVLKLIKQNDAVVSCLPYFCNIKLAELTHLSQKHYFDLTEDVETTNFIRELSKSAKGIMAPQCGLAPGFIGIVGANLIKQFDQDKLIDSVELRVGALPRNPRGKLGYAINWSADGVVNEYINNCEVIRNGVRETIPSMINLENVFIDGKKFEAFTTSGGLGTMCETYENKVKNLNYKTIRYPGHCDHINFLLDDLHLRDHPEMLKDLLTKSCPGGGEDLVFVYAAVEGIKNNKLHRAEYIKCYYPINIVYNIRKSISWTTAASLCAVIELVVNNKISNKGFLKQEDILLDDFLKTEYGRFF